MNEDDIGAYKWNSSMQTWQEMTAAVVPETNIYQCEISQNGIHVLLGIPTDYICGDFDGIGGINILEIVFFINYIYKNGPEPVCP